MSHPENMRNWVENISATPNQKDISTKNLNTIIESLKKWEKSQEKLNLAVNYVLKLSNIESKYNQSKQEIKNDVRTFIEASLWDKLYKHVSEYNVSKFDTDGQAWLDQGEEDNYWQALTKAIEQIIGLGGLKKFSTIHYESDSKSWIDTFIADKLNASQLWKSWDKNYIEDIFQKWLHLSQADYKAMAEAKFDITSEKSRWDLALLLSKDIGSGFESMLRFILNVPSWIILLPRYGTYRAELLAGNEEQKIEAQIKIDELVEQNPSLWLIELLWEKWWDVMKQMGKMATSGKTWDISNFAVNLAWLIWWWAWLVKIWAQLGRKWAVTSARTAGREARWTSREFRNWLKDTANWAWKVQAIAWKVDGVISWWAILWWTWNKEALKAKKMKPAREQVIANSSWAERWDRWLPNKILQENWAKVLTEDQIKIVERVHNEISKWIYQNKPEDIKKMTEALKSAWLEKNQIRILMENGITGQFKFDETFFTQIGKVSNDINKKWWIQTYLDWFSGKELSLEQLVMIIKDNPTIFKNPKELTEFLEAYDIKAPSTELINTALKWFHELNVKELLKEPKNIKISDITNISNSLDSVWFDAIIKKFFQEWNPNEINNFIKNFNETKLWFNFDISKLSNESLKAILESPSIDKTHLWRFISHTITDSLPIEKAKLIQSFLSSENSKWIFTDKLLEDYWAKLNTIIDKMAPQNIVDWFLKWYEKELYGWELAKNWWPAKSVWNLHFDKNYDGRFEMIFRWKPEFFFENNLDRFFNSSFFELTIENKSSLYDLIKEWWTYYEKIKWYRNYNEILDTAKTANNKINREK